MFRFIVSRLIANADDSIAESNKDEEFYKGHKLAYYEVLDTIKNELIAHGQDLKEYGLDINLENKFFSK